MAEEQLAKYLSKLQEQEKEIDQAEGVYDPLMNINWDISASEKEIEFRETIVNYLMDQNHDVLVENLKKQIPKEEMQTLLDSLARLNLFIEKLNLNQKTCESSGITPVENPPSFTDVEKEHGIGPQPSCSKNLEPYGPPSERILADIFHNISKEIWPHEGEEPNYSMTQFPAMEQIPTLGPIGNDSENSSAFKVFITFFLGFEIGGLCDLNYIFNFSLTILVLLQLKTLHHLRMLKKNMG